MIQISEYSLLLLLIERAVTVELQMRQAANGCAPVISGLVCRRVQPLSQQDSC
jgi:hypothetical protein